MHAAPEARSTEVAPASQQLVESRNVAFSGTVMVLGDFKDTVYTFFESDTLFLECVSVLFLVV